MRCAAPSPLRRGSKVPGRPPGFATRRPALALLIAAALALAGCGQKSAEQALDATDAALAKHEPATALVQAKIALQQAPESPRARYLMGLALLSAGDAAGAEAMLRRAEELGHPPEQSAPALAQALLAQGQAGRLIAIFRGTALAQSAAQARLKTLLAQAHWAQGEEASAEEALAAALAVDPQSVPARLLRVRDQAAKGAVAEAAADLENLLAQHPTDGEAWLLQGDLLRDRSAKAEEALGAYRKAAELRPSLPGGHLEVAETLLRLGRADEAAAPLAVARKLAPQSARGIYLQALRALMRLELADARKDAQVLLAGAPDNVRYLQLAGDVELQAGANALAEKHLTRALQLAPQAVATRHLLARAQLQSKQPVAALATLRPLLEGDAPPDATAAALAGDAWRASGNVEQAERQYSLAARLDPSDTRTRTALALAHLQAGRGETALAELREVAEAGPEVGPTLALINAHLVRQELPQALAAIEALKKKMPGSPLPFSLQGRAQVGARDLVKARQSFDQALVLSPLYFPAVDGLAALDLLEKKPDAARQRFEALLKQQPKNAEVLLALANLHAVSGGDKGTIEALLARAISAQPNNASLRLRLIDAHLRANDAAGAMSAAQDAAAALLQSAEVLDALARVQLARGEAGAAIQTSRKRAALQPLAPMPLVRLAAAQHAARDYAAAGDSLRRALALQPDLLEAQRGLVTLAVESRDFAGALALARKVQQQRPKDVAGYLLEGEVEAAQRHWAAAAAVYERGLKQVASSELARRAHATLGAAGQAVQGDRLATAWLTDHPQDAAFRLYLGGVSVAKGNFPAAEKFYAAAVQLQPANPEALNNLAWVSGRLGRPDALAHAEKAVALSSGDPSHLDTLAMLLAQKKDYAQALSRQRSALALQPRNGQYRLNLARILVLAGQKDEARRELQALAGLGDKFGAQAEVKRLLQGL